MTNSQAELREQMQSMCAVVRSDLQISRQLQGGDPIYVVHDPVSFQTHRLTKLQYVVFVELAAEMTIGDVFNALRARKELTSEQADVFFDLVVSLHKANLIILPAHQGEVLFRQYEKIESLKRRNRLMSALFLRIPLSNPDPLLKRTLRFMSWPFSRWFLYVWIGFGAGAVAVLIANHQSFVEPLNGIVSVGNLPFLWAIFVALKLWHELGHGFACRRFGGCVPEMGTILIVGNPLAYVDATAAWSFPERRKRLSVMCAGMYFESIVAIPAIFVWSISQNSTVGSIAYQIVITATFVTVLFNANPLMKFDGYFILSEVVRIPNLRSRADQQVRRTLKRLFLGIREGQKETTGSAVFLLLFGLCSSLYRTSLVLSISFLIATKFPAVGIAIGLYYAGSSLCGFSKKVISYLLTSHETQPIRGRAAAVAVGLFIVGPMAMAFVPVPFGIVAQGVVTAEEEHRVRVETPGIVEGLYCSPGMAVKAGTELIELHNNDLDDRLQLLEHKLDEAMLKWRIARERDVNESARIAFEIKTLEIRRDEIRRQRQRLSIKAPESGKLLDTREANESGKYLKVGETVALICDGHTQVRAWLTQEQLDRIHPTTKSRLEKSTIHIRTAANSSQTVTGDLINISPAAETVVPAPAVTILGGGDIVVDPESRQPMQTLFQVDIRPRGDLVSIDRYGERVALSFPRAYESIGHWGYRRCLQMIQKLLLA